MKEINQINILVNNKKIKKDADEHINIIVYEYSSYLYFK